MKRLGAIIVAGAVLLAGCAGASMKSDSEITHDSSSQQNQENDALGKYLLECKTNGTKPDVTGLISFAVDEPSVKSAVKGKYGDLSGKNYCLYFTSPEFQEQASRVLGVPVTIVFEPDSDNDYDRTYPANSTLLSLEEDDEYYFACDSIGSDGKKEVGGSGVTLEGSPEYGD